jgi:hypothetical protein
MKGGSERIAVYDPNIQAKDFAREIGNVRHVITKVPDRNDLIEYGRPYADPSREC